MIVRGQEKPGVAPGCRLITFSQNVRTLLGLTYGNFGILSPFGCIQINAKEG